VKVPYFTELKDTEIEIGNVADYKKFRAEYINIMKTIILKMEEAIPKKYPQILPNLSTHSGKPPLVIRDQDDFAWVLASYHNFVSKMECLKNEWTVTLRTLYPAVQQMEEFEKMSERQAIKKI